MQPQKGVTYGLIPDCLSVKICQFDVPKKGVSLSQAGTNSPQETAERIPVIEQGYALDECMIIYISPVYVSQKYILARYWKEL